MVMRLHMLSLILMVLIIFFSIILPWNSCVGSSSSYHQQTNHMYDEQGEHVLILGDSLDRNAIRDYCEYHGVRQSGTQAQLYHQNNDTVEGMIGYMCENRFGDTLSFVHLFDSGLDTNVTVNPFATIPRIYSALQYTFQTQRDALLLALNNYNKKQKRRQRRRQTKVILHTSNWDRSYGAYLPMIDKAGWDLDATFSNSKGYRLFYNNMKYLVNYTQQLLVGFEKELSHIENHEEESGRKQSTSDIRWFKSWKDSNYEKETNAKSSTHSTTKTSTPISTRIILRSAPLPNLKTMSKHDNVTMAYMNKISRRIAKEEELEYYDYDADIWSIADYQCGCRNSFYHQQLFTDDIHPNRVLASRYIEKILGLRFTRFYYDYRQRKTKLFVDRNEKQSKGDHVTAFASLFEMFPMSVPRWELCNQQLRKQDDVSSYQSSSITYRGLPSDHGITRSSSKRNSGTGSTIEDMLQRLLQDCPEYEIPIIPRSEQIAIDSQDLHHMEHYSQSIENQIRHNLFHDSHDITSDYYLSIVPHFSFSATTTTTKSQHDERKRFFFQNLTNTFMLQGYFGWGDIYYYHHDNHRNQGKPVDKMEPIYPIPYYLLLPSTSVLVRVVDRTSSSSSSSALHYPACYLLSEKCHVLYRPPDIETSMNIFCELITKHWKFTPLPLISLQAPIDNLFLRWKYGNGFNMTQQYYDGVLIATPHRGNLYSYMKKMVRVFHAKEKDRVLKFLNKTIISNPQHTKKLQTRLEDAIWLPSLSMMDCLPIGRA